MFGKKLSVKSYDKETQRPVIKCSICNGEQVAGLKDIRTGKFEEVMFLRNEKDLEKFIELYQLNKNEISKEY